MLNIFKPIQKEYSSKYSPEVVIRNIGLHIGKRRGIMAGDCDTLFSGEVDADQGRFVIRNQRNTMNRNSTMVRAEGQVSHSGTGSIVRLTLKMSQFGLVFLIGFMLMLVGGALAFILKDGAAPGADATTFYGMAIGGIAAYLGLFFFIMQLAIRREFRVLESYVKRQATLDHSAAA